MRFIINGIYFNNEIGDLFKLVKKGVLNMKSTALYPSQGNGLTTIGRRKGRGLKTIK